MKTSSQKLGRNTSCWVVGTLGLKRFRLGKGRVPKKKRISYGLFTDKKIYPHFFLEIEYMIAKTNFTLDPNGKSFFLSQLKWFTFSIN